jgi:hypothetical protein
MSEMSGQAAAFVRNISESRVHDPHPTMFADHADGRVRRVATVAALAKGTR